jgi:NAD(P)-dependent dehydrogenase (short-subunit alcohol dehydrogenase family)
VTQTYALRRAIVVGSDSGIGRATAVALARAGADVGITWNADEAGGQQTAEEVRAAGQRAEVVQLDTTEFGTAGDRVDDLVGRLGGVDAFVQVSGTGSSTLALDLSFDDWRKVVATDLDGAFLCLQRAARHLVEAGNGGRLVAVTSVHEHQPRVGSAAYDAAKHGLGGLIKTLALELGQYGITANSVAPGEIATAMTGQEDEDPRGTERPGVPLRRPGDAHEVAAVIAFLCRPEASYVTGASLVVDGGMLQMGPQGGSHIPNDDWRSV